MERIIKQLKPCVISTIILLLFSGEYVRGQSNYSTDTLVLVHVLYRHGDRTPSTAGLWKTNPYYNESFYEPYGYGQLTNNGKRRMYNVGVSLRKRYDNFLGTTWNMNVLDAWTTNYNRTKMSTSLLLAGLYPPSGCLRWRTNLNWQPIPYNYLPVSQDKELSSWACPTVLQFIYNTTSTVERLKAYDGLISDLSKGTGESIDYISALDLYFGMLIQTELELPLENWTKSVFPEPFKKYIIDFYYIETSTKELRRIIAGYFLKKIIEDTQRKIDGTLDPSGRKIFLYSGHETNLGTIIAALNLLDMQDVPGYGSHLLFEVHKIDDVYGFMIYYQNFKEEDPILLTLPGCEAFCPVDDFVRLTLDIIPESDDDCYKVE
ncbi:venom acid phosphatase Acph-1-like [Rhynchophorus ferrugineus]|uniref:venom acid phosphatase Acph-1-like n=1 Tax=Rhynchophorus ferrugineus TaxID=354439 RepID=UPI003FCCF111